MREALQAEVLLAFAVGFALVLGPPAVQAQTFARTDSPAQSGLKERFIVGRFPLQPSLTPSVSIPIDAYGFPSPSTLYVGERYAVASLDFLDENRLLFTFRIPGLLHRDLAGEESDERRIRALVLTLPEGKVEAETSWILHDRSRYLWPLRNGQFLLRDRNTLYEGDAALRLKPWLDFPGTVLSVAFDPEQKLLLTNSHEPVKNAPNPGGTANADSGSGNQAFTGEIGRPETVVRILRRDTGNVLFVNRIRAPADLPINSSGSIETIRGRELSWLLNLNFFAGGSTMIGSVDSACVPRVDFLSEREFLVTACGPSMESKLVAMTTGGQTLWLSHAPSTLIWPQLIVAANGSRLAWETLDVVQSVDSLSPLSSQDVKEQSVTIFDAATGDIAMVSPVNPVLDVGGNVALSPSGRRVALINNGAIQVFDLPAAPQLPATTTNP